MQASQPQEDRCAPGSGKVKPWKVQLKPPEPQPGQSHPGLLMVETNARADFEGTGALMTEEAEEDFTTPKDGREVGAKATVEWAWVSSAQLGRVAPGDSEAQGHARGSVGAYS